MGWRAGCGNRADKWMLVAGVFPVLVWAAQSFVGEGTFLLFFGLAMPPLFYCVPTLVGLIVSIITRRWYWTVLNSVVFGGALFFLGGLTLGSAVRTSAESLRLMTFNVQLFLNHDASEIASIILAEKPDIMFLQEVPPIEESPSFRELLKEYKIVQHRRMAVATKYAVKSATSVELSDRRNPPAQIVTVDYPGTRLRLVNVHLPAFPQHDLTQVGNAARNFGLAADGLGSLLSGDAPTVLAGDMNMVAQSKLHRTLRRTMRDCFAFCGRGFGHTMPAKFPLRRIDYIYVGQRLRPVKCYVPKAIASDHLAVVADVVLSE